MVAWFIFTNDYHSLVALVSMPARSPVVYNTYEPSWQDLAPLSICAGLKELLAPKKMKVQAFNIYKGDTELLGECDVR